jgi:sodium transport system permease protein
MRERVADIRTLYVRELRSALRERNIVINSILLPIFLYPLMLWIGYSVITFVAGQSELVPSRVMFDNLPVAHSEFSALIESEDTLEPTTTSDPEAAIRDGSLDLLVRFLEPREDIPMFVDNFRAELVYDASKDRSRTAQTRLRRQLSDYRQTYLLKTAEEAGVAPGELQQLWVEDRNVATGREMGQFILALIVPMFLIIMLSVGGLYPEIDSTAGERENSTWETLMTIAPARSSILISKYLYVATMSFSAGMLNVAAMTFSMKTILTALAGDELSELTMRLPLASVPVIIVGAALMALFIAAGMMILASFARTFKEGQSMVGPFYIAMILPLMFLQVPDIEFTPRLAAIPIVNVTLMFREAIAGTYQWSLIGITVAVEVATIALALAVATKVLQYEDFILGGYSGSFGKFLKQRLMARSQ